MPSRTRVEEFSAGSWRPPFDRINDASESAPFLRAKNTSQNPPVTPLDFSLSQASLDPTTVNSANVYQVPSVSGLASNPAIRNSVVNHVIETIVAENIAVTQDDRQSISLQIHPAEMGELRIHVGTESDVMKAQIVASELFTSELLVREKHQLISALQEMGIDLGDVEISYQDSDPRFDQNDFDDRRLDSPRKFETASRSENHRHRWCPKFHTPGHQLRH